MHFLFLLKHTHILGGVETLAGRMTRWLVREKHKVTILSNEIDVGFKQLCDPETCFISHKRGPYALGSRDECAKVINEHGLCAPEVIKAYDPESWLEAGVLCRCLNPNPKVLAGDYLPLFPKATRKTIRGTRNRLCLRYFLKELSYKNRIFISNEQKLECMSRVGSEVDGHLWPLPLEVSRLRKAPRVPQKGVLVSVGRLSPMKEYNFYMVDVVDELRRKGHEVTWDVYGDGPDEQAIISTIQNRGLQKVIRLHGRLPYEKLADALKPAFAFIGMGTAAAEAAACGVPVVVAIAHDRLGVTYGRISMLPFGNMGDRIAGQPTRRVVDELRTLLDLSAKAYEIAAQEDTDYVQQYDMDLRMGQFMKIVDQASPVPISKLLTLSYIVHMRLEQMLRFTSTRCRGVPSSGCATRKV